MVAAVGARAGRARARRRHRDRARRAGAGAQLRVPRRCARPERRDARAGAAQARGRSGARRPHRAGRRRGRVAARSTTASSTTSPSPTCSATSTIRRPRSRELARVVRPGGRVACARVRRPARSVALAVARSTPASAFRRSAGSPGASGTRSAASSGRASRASTRAIRSSGSSRCGGEPGIANVTARRMSLGGGLVIWGTRMPTERPAFYALAPGGWRDLATILHPPYTLWHLSYVALGAAAAPQIHADRLIAALAAFFLAVGVGAHALDELHGRPLQTAALRPALIALATVGLAGALAIGVAGVVIVSATLAPFVIAGGFARPGLQPGALRRPLPHRLLVRRSMGSVPRADRLVVERAGGEQRRRRSRRGGCDGSAASVSASLSAGSPRRCASCAGRPHR